MLALSLLLICSTNSYSQKVTNKDLIGRWVLANFTTDVRIFNGKIMTDSLTNMKDDSTIKQVPYRISYILDTSAEVTLLYLHTKDRLHFKEYDLIKIEGNVLKMQGGLRTKPQKWYNETSDNTTLFNKIN